MKKKLLSLLLVLIMLLGMLPAGVLAASESDLSGTRTEVTDYEKITIPENEFYNEGSRKYVRVNSLTIEGAKVIAASVDETDVYVLLSNKTQDDASITAEFGFETPSALYTGSQDVKDLTLENGDGTLTVTLYAKYSKTEKGSCQYTIHFLRADPSGKEIYTVTLPTDTEAYTVTAEKGFEPLVDEGESVSFTLTIDDRYKKGADFAVKANETVLVEKDGVYTIENIQQDQNVTVNGVVPKVICTVTLTEGTGYTISPVSQTSYQDESYSFIITVDHAYKADGMKVMLDGTTELKGVNGAYTVPALSGNHVVTVTGLVEKEIYTVTLPEVTGVTVAGESDVIEGDDYTFTVTFDEGYIPGADFAVKANDLRISAVGGKYTIRNVTAEQNITVEGVVPVSTGDGTAGTTVQINHSVASVGSLNSVTFTDPNGNTIHGLTASINETTIDVTLPKSFDLSGSVLATFDLTQNETVDEIPLPFISTTNKASGSSKNKAVNNRFTEKPVQLTRGAAAFTFYFYDHVPSTNANDHTTYIINFAVKNELPKLKDGQSGVGSATITAGETHSLNLTDIFTDADGDALTYQVSENGKSTVQADANYSFTTDVAGTYELVFTADDGIGTSTTYTLTVTVENSTDTENMTIHIPDGQEPAFYVANGYDADGVDVPGDQLTPEGGENGAYTIHYPANAEAISVRTGDAWGGLAIPVSENGTVALRKVTLSGKDMFEKAVAGTVTVRDAGDHAVTVGTEGFLLITGQAYTLTLTPEDTTSYRTASAAQTVASGADAAKLSISVEYNNLKTVTTPTGATAQLYLIGNYYVYPQVDCAGTKDNGNGTSTHYFPGALGKQPNTSQAIWRVEYGDRIVKAGWTNSGSVTVTYSESDIAKNARVDYSKSTEGNKDVADDGVLLNINGQNHLSMSEGDSYILKAYRVWELIYNQSNNWIIEPDFHFNVVWESETGVVSLANKENQMPGGESWQTLTANKPGTAIIEVTYDAIQLSGATSTGGFNGTYGATDPARSGLMVVTVGGADSSVNFGIESFASLGSTTFSQDNARAWDAEFDTLYFTGDSGELKLSPTATSAVQSVAVSGDKGDSWTTLTADGGVYTATIVPGNNIIRVTTAAGTAYQVVRGDKVTYTVAEVSGDGKSDGDGIIEAGETIRITIAGLHTPIPKMAGNYNPGYAGNTDGDSLVHMAYTFGDSTITGAGAQYDFHTTANYIDVTIPAEATGSLSLTDGYIGVGVIGQPAFLNGEPNQSHRNIPETGLERNDNGVTTWHTRSILPEITIAIGAEAAPNTAPSVRAGAPNTATLELTEKNYTYAINLATDVFTDEDTADILTYTVKVNDETVSPVQNGHYTLVRPEVGTYTLLFTVSDGKATAEHSITLTVTQATQTDPEPAPEPEPEPKPDDSQVKGYVYVSFEDYGKRVAGESGVRYPNPLGVIVSATQVPFYEGDTIADVTLRLLDSKGMTCSHSGTTKANFYLSSIGNFAVGGIRYSSFGEFDAGNGSGWMITRNNVFIGRGASDFAVKDGDVIEWQYTCQLGADIGGGVGDVEDDDKPVGGGGDEDDDDDDDEPTEEDYDAAEAVEKLIDKIGTVTKDSAKVIEKARKAYDELSDKQKELVNNYDELLEAEKEFAEISSKLPFTDVKETDYFYDAVKWAVEMGITEGTDATSFSPNASCTRAQMVTFLWRAAGEPKTKNTTCSFTDVDKDAYYYEALLWALEKGITTGTTASTFSPDSACTRAQMATFLYRSAGSPKVSGKHSFVDVKDGAFYTDAVIWAAAEGITTGTSQTTFSPGTDCTRGQMVTFLYRYLAE